MQAIEFNTEIKGENIRMPHLLSCLTDKHVKIIVLYNGASVKPHKQRRKFDAIKLSTRNFKFDRNELYAR